MPRTKKEESIISLHPSGKQEYYYLDNIGNIKAANWLGLSSDEQLWQTQLISATRYGQDRVLGRMKAYVELTRCCLNEGDALQWGEHSKYAPFIDTENRVRSARHDKTKSFYFNSSEAATTFCQSHFLLFQQLYSL